MGLVAGVIKTNCGCVPFRYEERTLVYRNTAAAAAGTPAAAAATATCVTL